MLAQFRVRVDRVRMTDQGQHRDVVVRIAVGRAAFQVQALGGRERAYRLGLRRAVQGFADQPARVDAVDRLGDGAQGAGEAEAPGDDRGGLHRGGGDQPDPLARVEVGLRQGAGAGPDAVGHVLVVDLLADGHQLGDAVALDDGQGAVAGVLHVLRVLDAGQPEPGLLPGEPGQFAALEELALVQAAAEVEDRGALHHGVVEVEEGGGPGVPGHRERGLSGVLGGARQFFGAGGECRLLCGLGCGLACEHAACRGGAPAGGEPSKSGHVVSIAIRSVSSRPGGMRRCELSGTGALNG